MKVTIVDIETVSLSESELPPFDESSVLVGNLKNPELIKAKIDAARAEWIANAALSPITGKIAMVGFKEVGGEVRILADMPELDIVAQSFEIISLALSGGETVAGFNCASFDLPYMARRGWKLGLRLPNNLRRGRYWADGLVDLREEWLLGDRSPAKGTSSLEAIAKFLGLPPKLGTGADFAGLTQEDRLAYLEGDLVTTEALWMAIH